MMVDRKELLVAIDNFDKELREIQEFLPFFKLMNDSSICAEKRMKEILVLRKIVNYQLQIGNYRRAIRYFLAVKLLLNDLKPYKKKAAKRATEYMLRRS